MYFDETISLVEKLTEKNQLILVALAVLLSQKFYTENKEEFNVSQLNILIKSAVDKVGIDHFWIKIISSWNRYSWNKIQSWAISIVNKPQE